ncbi:nucleolar and coiled-body phosphoprotein [Anaeramoeba ignava]|uniref:Nucleolar and coiled-body phosphoprotein n=1 Tax=Anaeramoeba ignava TaxID=1746090 RepID=A0A9Q0L909_ANAIG|nr:nucleolar and coiled-body phosphoprotein [Anaeramoeba ignava]|eukprot:Anaeramoba_ignava/a480508_62.p1 GENE.a480508_62~~a480508_62.p1  ORF type:complete len:733 (-),score=237.06 a480508_62:51-2249(-)
MISSKDLIAQHYNWFSEVVKAEITPNIDDLTFQKYLCQAIQLILPQFGSNLTPSNVIEQFKKISKKQGVPEKALEKLDKTQMILILKQVQTDFYENQILSKRNFFEVHFLDSNNEIKETGSITLVNKKITVYQKAQSFEQEINQNTKIKIHPQNSNVIKLIFDRKTFFILFSNHEERYLFVEEFTKIKHIILAQKNKGKKYKNVIQYLKSKEKNEKKDQQKNQKNKKKEKTKKKPKTQKKKQEKKPKKSKAKSKLDEMLELDQKICEVKFLVEILDELFQTKQEAYLVLKEKEFNVVTPENITRTRYNKQLKIYFEPQSLILARINFKTHSYFVKFPSQKQAEHFLMLYKFFKEHSIKLGYSDNTKKNSSENLNNQVVTTSTTSTTSDISLTKSSQTNSTRSYSSQSTADTTSLTSTSKSRQTFESEDESSDDQEDDPKNDEKKIPSIFSVVVSIPFKNYFGDGIIETENSTVKLIVDSLPFTTQAPKSEIKFFAHKTNPRLGKILFPGSEHLVISFHSSHKLLLFMEKLQEDPKQNTSQEKLNQNSIHLDILSKDLKILDTGEMVFSDLFIKIFTTEKEFLINAQTNAKIRKHTKRPCVYQITFESSEQPILIKFPSLQYVRQFSQKFHELKKQRKQQAQSKQFTLTIVNSKFEKISSIKVSFVDGFCYEDQRDHKQIIEKNPQKILLESHPKFHNILRLKFNSISVMIAFDDEEQRNSFVSSFQSFQNSN